MEQPDWERQAAEEEIQRQRELAERLEAKRAAQELAQPELPWYSNVLDWLVRIYDPGRAEREANQLYPAVTGSGMSAARYLWLVIMLVVVLLSALILRACVVPLAEHRGEAIREAREQFVQQQAEIERIQQETEQVQGL